MERACDYQDIATAERPLPSSSAVSTKSPQAPSENRCPISWNQLTAENAITTSCGHTFIESSLQQWLLTKTPSHRSCPSCRSPLSLNYKTYAEFNASITCDSDSESVLEELNNSPLSKKEKQQLILTKVRAYVDNSINNIRYLREIELTPQETADQFDYLINETTTSMSQLVYIRHSPFGDDVKNSLYLEKANTHFNLKSYLNLFNELQRPQNETNEKIIEKLTGLTPDEFISTIQTTALIYLNPMKPELKDVELTIKDDVLKLKADASQSLEDTTRYFNATRASYQATHPDYLSEREHYFDSLRPPTGYAFTNCLFRLCRK